MVELLTKPTLNVQYAIWTLIGSSEFAVTGEPFTLICNPHDNNFLALAIYWKRFDIDANGTFRAVVEKTGCKIGPGYDTQYQYTCEPGPLYKLTIPANVMTNSQNNIEWRCGSIFGGAEAYFTITVANKPIISLSNRMVVVAEGQDVEIICSAIGNPTPIVNWHRENLPYAFGNETSATLALERAKRNDTGIYNCKANARGNSGNQSQIFMSEESIKIYVFYFTINKATPVCSSSESISISCCSVNNYSKPLKFYGWKHRMGNTTVRSLEGKLSTMNYNTLSIDYCGYYDSGIYTCEAAVDIHNDNLWYSFSSSIELVVTAPPVVSSNMLDTDVNTKRKMSVKFYSVPKPDIVEWIKDGEKLTLSNKYQQITLVKNVTLLFYEKTVVVKGYESSMSIVNPVESDFGTYTFRVQNSEGSAQVKLLMDSVSAVCVFKRRKKRQNCESVSKDQISDIKHESNNEENNSYQDVDIQMYEELDATNKSKSQYDTLQEQRITCDTQQ